MVVLVVAPVGGCLCRSEPKAESHVDVPTKLAEVKKLHAPPDVVVKVKRVKKSMGAAPCHSAVCLILAPIILANALFPEKYDLVVVTRKGTETYRGTFRTNGDLIQASVRQGDQLKVVRALLLRGLERKVVVEVSRARVDAAGKVSDQEPVSIQSQVDLLGAYREAMAPKKLIAERADLLQEALTHLGDEAMKLALARLAAEKDPDRAVALKKICRVATVKKNRAAVLKLVRKEGGARSANMVLTGCLSGLKPDRNNTEAMLSLVVQATCDGDCFVHGGALTSWYRKHEDYRAFLVKEAGACKERQGGAVLRLLLSQQTPAGELEAVLKKGTRQNRRCVARALDVNRAAHLKLAVGALANEPAPLLHQDLMRALAPHKGPLKRRALEAALDSYLLPRRLLEARGHALGWFHKIEDAAVRKRARARVEEALTGAHKDDQTALGAALVALGKHDAALAAVQAASGRRTISMIFPYSPKLIDRPVKLVAYVLKLKGCKNRDIGKALRELSQGKEVKPSLCL